MQNPLFPMEIPEKLIKGPTWKGKKKEIFDISKEKPKRAKAPLKNIFNYILSAN